MSAPEQAAPEGLAALEAEHEALGFSRFSNQDALDIGLDLVAVARAGNLAVTIDIIRHGQQLFHAALPGTSPDNDQWVIRKNRVVERFHRSSFLIASRLRSEGRTIEEAWGLPSADYAPFGGAFPIIIGETGVVGTITVSGLPDQEDHRMVVEAIRRHLDKLTGA